MNREETELRNTIEEAWNHREMLKDAKVVEAIEEVLEDLDKGKRRIAEKTAGGWVVNGWLVRRKGCHCMGCVPHLGAYAGRSLLSSCVISQNDTAVLFSDD